VRSKIPQSIYVRPDAPQVEPLAVDVADFPQLTGVEQLFHVANGGIVNKSVTGHDHQTTFLCERSQFIHFSYCGGQELLHKHILASQQGVSRQFKMSTRRRSDDDSV